MAIISANKSGGTVRHIQSQYRYAAVYLVITMVVLLFLNIYCSGTSQKLFYQNKETAMLERCQLIAAEIAELEVLNTSTVSTVISQMSSLKITRLIITDLAGSCVYDSAAADSIQGSHVLLPEVFKALTGFDVFTWNYHAGVMRSRAAVPIYAYGTMIGCVYMTEYDIAQGQLLQSLQLNILTITLVLGIVVVIFSLIFSKAFSRRMEKILASMHIIREGDYTHKVVLDGRDELTFLGAEINNLTNQLQVSENKRAQFVSDASHELKTPLASIKLLSDSILQNDMDLDTIREFVGDIGHEADRLNRMSQKLLSLSRIEGTMDGDCEILYLTPTIERAVRMLSGIAQETDICIHLELLEDSPILAVEDDLYQIAFNLIENGIKYTPPGGRVTVSLLRSEDNILLQIADTGVGIPEESLAHIFERFYRVDKARSRKSGGSGLGLSIVRNMVERNQGHIQVESAVGQGSVFTVIFPVFDTEEASS